MNVLHAKTVGLDLPSDFPVKLYETVYWNVDRRRKTSKAVWDQYRDAWKGFAFRFLSCSVHDDEFTRSVEEKGPAPPQPARWRQEHELFGFFVTGLASLESMSYGLYAVAAMIKPDVFPMTTEKEMKGISPESVSARILESFDDVELGSALNELVNDQRYKEWKGVRNVLEHRAHPGRAFVLIAGATSADRTGQAKKGESAKWVHEMEIDENTTRSRRDWLSRSITEILGKAGIFTDKYC